MAVYFTAPRRRLLISTISRRVPPARVPFEVRRRQRQVSYSERSRINGVLIAPSRTKSVGTTQGATSATAGGLVFPTVDGAGTNWWVDVTVTDVDPTLGTTGTFADAVTAARRYPIKRIRVDWNRDGYQSPYADVSDAVTDVTVDRAATGDLPDETTLIEGTTIAQVVVTLGGRVAGTEVIDLLAPWRADSPFYRKALINCPVTVELGLLLPDGPEFEPQMVGHIRAIKPNSAARTVQLTFLDPADLLRAAITLPAHAMYRDDWLNSRHKFYINSQAVIDFILRKNGIYASSAAHPDAQISCTGHGWLAAEAGRSAVPRGVAAVIADATWWTSGPFDMLAVRGVWNGNAAYTEFFARGPYSPTPGNGIGMAAWVRIGTDFQTPTDFRAVFQLFPYVDNTAMHMDMGFFGNGGLDGTIYTPSSTNGFTQGLTSTTKWQYVGLHFQHMSNGNTRIRYRANGATTFGDVATPIVPKPLNAYLQCTAWTDGPDWCNFQVWYSYNPPDLVGDGSWPGETGLNQADIDVGLNYLTHLPDIVNADSWQLMSDVAAAEYGLVGFDETGRFVFTSRDTSTRDTSFVEETLTTDRSLMDLVTETSGDSVRNVITTETVSGFLDFNNVVFEAQSATQFNTYPGTTTFPIKLPYGAIGTTVQQLPRITNANWGATVLSGYVLVDAYTPANEVDPAADVSVLFTMAGDRKGLITVRNNSPYYLQFSTTGGQPALRVQGFLLELNPTELETNAKPGSVALYGARSLAVGSSPWRQLLWAMRPVALRLAAELAYPVPVVDQFSAVGNPARTVGDTLRLVDDTGQGSIRATITKITRTMSADQGLVDRLTVRPVGPPGRLILGDPEQGILGDPHLYLGPTS